MNPFPPSPGRWLVSIFDPTSETSIAPAAATVPGEPRAAPPEMRGDLPAAPPPGAPTEAAGSRRARLWELPHGTLCPLMGVCLPITTLRRVLGKTVGGALQDDYQVHCSAINQCTQRCASSETLHRELEARHAVAVRRFAKAKAREAVAALWCDESVGNDPAGALWAALTHPRCDAALRERICSDVHMLQHQLGAGNRADLERLRALDTERMRLQRELAAAQERHARVLGERSAHVDCLAAQLMRLRAEGIRKDSSIAALREDLQAFQPEAGIRSAAPGRDQRLLEQRLVHLERELERAHAQALTEAARADLLANELAQARRAAADRTGPAPATADPGEAEALAGGLNNAAVLCVGGRTGSVPAYRRLVEVTGGRFAHHDGGEQQSVAQLEASLAAADLVICQTGCISHGAYWRVKEHCKRTGKRCVFVDNPSAASLARSLRAVPERA